MKIKCIALDLDGTVLDGRGELSQGNKEALEEAGIDARLRPEQLAVTDFQRICDGWSWGIAQYNGPGGNREADEKNWKALKAFVE